jgi:hypothetical protein
MPVGLDRKPDSAVIDTPAYVALSMVEALPRSVEANTSTTRSALLPALSANVSDEAKPLAALPDAS